MLKKLRSFSRYIGILLMFAMIVPILFGIVSGVNYLFFRKEDYVIRVGDSKIQAAEINAINGRNQKMLFVSSLYEDKAALSLKNKMNIDVSSEKLEETYQKYLEEAKKNVGAFSEKEAIKYYYNQSPKLLKSSIYLLELRNALSEAINNSYSPTEREIKEYFIENYGDNIKLSEVKEEIVSKLKKDSKYFNYIFAKEIESIEAEAKEGYEDLLRDSMLKAGNLVIHNHDFNKRYLSLLPYSQYLPVIGDDLELRALHYTYDEFEKNILLAREAQKRGLRAKRNLREEDKILSLSRKLQKDLEKDITVDSEEIENYYKNNLDDFTSKEKAEANIIFLPLIASSSDKKRAKELAGKLFEEALSTNELPDLEKNSVSLDEFKAYSRKRVVRDNEIVPEIINVSGGFQIAKREGDVVNYVLINIEISDDTKNDVNDKAEGIFNRISSTDLSIEEAMERYSDINFRTTKTVERSSDLNKELIESVLSKDGLVRLDTKEGIFIHKRTEYSAEKIKELDEAKPRIERKLKDLKLKNNINNLVDELKAQDPVRVKKSFLTDRIIRDLNLEK